MNTPLLQINDLHTDIEIRSGVVRALSGVDLHVNPGETLSLRTREYVVAMRGMGGSMPRAIRTHIVRNTIGTVIVNATFQVADAVLYVAYLSFLGLGAQPPATDWGAMLSNSQSHVYSGNWWLLYPPGVLIILLVLSFNFIGDGLRDAFEVRLRKR